MAWQMFAQVGLSALQGVMNYKAKKAQYKAQEAWRKYSNTMVNLGNAINQNAITTNEILAMQESAFKATEIKKATMQQSGAVEAAAAAAGVKGRSVNQAMFNVQKSAAKAEYNRTVNLKNQFLAFDQQRLQSSMSAAMQQNHQQAQKPSLLNEMIPAISKAAGMAMDGGLGSLFGGGGGATAATSSLGIGLSQGSSTSMLSLGGSPTGTAFVV